MDSGKNVNRIPDDLDFDLSMLEPRWIVTTDVNGDTHGRPLQTNERYKAEYDGESRILTITLEPANQTIFEFNIKTKPTVEALSLAQQGKTFETAHTFLAWKEIRPILATA